MSWVEFYYAQTSDKGELDLNTHPINVYPLNDEGVGYRNPFRDPEDSFSFNDLGGLHGYIRVVDHHNETIWKAFIDNDELKRMKNDFIKGDDVVYANRDGCILCELEHFGDNIICFKIIYRSLK